MPAACSNTEDQPYSVGQVNQFIRQMIDRESGLKNIYVEGELSNYKRYASGHHYFSMKDDTGSIKCVMFKGDNKVLFEPENGMRVVAFGTVAVYTRDGAYQLYVTQLIPTGAGALHIEFEQLKKRLEAEGLFSATHKKPLPKLPKRIGVVTSGSGAAFHDILRVLGARWPMAEVILIPARVQGEQCPEEVASAIEYADENHVADVLIVGRGGGSMEDLWGFNSERIARAIYAASTPIISAVGHEPDFTIADFVADVRAATPSNGAELAVPDQAEVRAIISKLRRRLQVNHAQRLRNMRIQLDSLTTARVLTQPATQFIYPRQQDLDMLTSRLQHLVKASMYQRRHVLTSLTRSKYLLDPMASVTAQQERVQKLEMQMQRAETQRLHKLRNRLITVPDLRPRLSLLRQNCSLQQMRTQNSIRLSIVRRREHLRERMAKLDALSPLKVLARGYAYVSKADTHTVVSNTRQVQTGDVIDIRLADGIIRCSVCEILTKGGARNV